MTRKMRGSSPLPELSTRLSGTRASRYKNHRRIPQESPYEEYYYTNSSPSQSAYESNEDELEQSLNENYESESKPKAPIDQRSTRIPKLIPESKIGLKTEEPTSSFASDPANSSANSYINVAPLPIFQGAPDECAVTHLSRFTKVCRANNVPTVEMMMRIFPVTLEKEAALWYDLNIDPYPLLSWEEIKSSFLQAYHKIETIDELRMELMMLNQGIEEPVRSYFLRLQWILKRWPDHGLSDDLLKRIFVDGLREEFKDWIVKQKPDSLAEALRLAFGFEQVRCLKEKVLKCGFCEGKHEEQSCEIKQKLKEFWFKSKKRQSAKVDNDEEVPKDEKGSASCGEGCVKNNEEGELLGSMKRKNSQCQCWKHQCWKKRLERNNSLVATNSTAD